MSSIAFNSPSGKVYLGGPERAYMGLFCAGLATALLRTDAYDSNLLALVQPDSYIVRHSEKQRSLASLSTAVRIGEDVFVLDGRPVNTFQMVLNTALKIGNPCVQLLARIHGQCEIHCFIEGVNRGWVAGIIDEGLGRGIYRSDERLAGWQTVAGFLRSRTDEPVVLSYSVTDGFPNSYIAGFGDDDDEAFYDLPDADRWELSIKALRTINEGTREIKPDGFPDFYFGDENITAFDIVNAANLAAKGVTA